MAGGAAPAAVVASGPAVSKRQEYFAFALVTSLFFLWGFSYGLLDVLNKHFQNFFSITKLESTCIQVAYFGAYIVYSPVAGQFISRFGYKNGIFMGLALYSIGALCFWPSAHFQKYAGFVASAFVIACGLATLEVCANSYIAVLGSPERAGFRLNFAQSFNGVAAFVGPLIASKYFFSDSKDSDNHSLGSIQFVYLAVACLGATVAVLFFFAKMPEISEAAMTDMQEQQGYRDDRPLWKRKHCMLGFVTQFAYVGAQVTVASFVMNYLTDHGSYTDASAARMFSYMQITFMVARFASTPLLRYFDNALILAAYGAMCTIFSLVAALTGGKVGVACLFIIFFFESVCYPTTFTLATMNLGPWTKRGGALVVMGVGGGAAFPPMQGALADARGTTISYVIPFIGFLFVAVYGAGMYFYCKRFERLVAEAEANMGSGFDTPVKEKDEDKLATVQHL
ncbi:hypothetical protein OIV83_000986 [Microbotryomycetes sp. JL201]|nr:hypothetical protein OIV83_000986 [Microbotryomycetes sp. JL201]